MVVLKLSYESGPPYFDPNMTYFEGVMAVIVHLSVIRHCRHVCVEAVQVQQLVFVWLSTVVLTRPVGSLAGVGTSDHHTSIAMVEQWFNRPPEGHSPGIGLLKDFTKLIFETNSTKGNFPGQLILCKEKCSM